MKKFKDYTTKEKREALDQLKKHYKEFLNREISDFIHGDMTREEMLDNVDQLFEVIDVIRGLEADLDKLVIN